MTTPSSNPLPLLFLDVDGPLIPFGRPGGYPTYHSGPSRWPEDDNPLLSRVNPAHGAHLAALARSCDLVWATTWMDEANECVAPRLGLPRLPVVAWPEPSDGEGRGGPHSKTPALLAYAAGRPFVWLDDELTDTDRRWVAAHGPAPALLHPVDPREGLRDGDFATVESWLAVLPTLL
ncbi:HAD domain-containing protein [Streptomyces sp. NPDC006530]|uniref:HAD domain-containing protein n=1 Tax=Streptomyces sp. NPDC006530 TaxID=3364750 RepID=UPI003692959B